MKNYDVNDIIAQILRMDLTLGPTMRYSCAILIFIVATTVRLIILPVEAGLPYITYFPTTAFVALVFGTGPALITIVLGAAIGHYVFVPPFWSWKPEFEQLIAVGIFVSSGILICIVAHHRRLDRIALQDANKQLQKLARVDGLTGASNKRMFEELIAIEWLRGIRSKTSIGLLMIDIDNFKAYNDNHGHLAGDKCLTDIVAAITAIVRHPPDIVARFGGEEFVCLLPGAELDGTAAVGQRVLDEIRNRRLPHGFSDVAEYVTVSIGGAAMVPEEGTDYTTLIEAADCLLYRAKDDGRNNLTTRCSVCDYQSCTKSGAKLPCQHIRNSHQSFTKCN